MCNNKWCELHTDNKERNAVHFGLHFKTGCKVKRFLINVVAYCCNSEIRKMKKGYVTTISEKFYHLKPLPVLGFNEWPKIIFKKDLAAIDSLLSLHPRKQKNSSFKREKEMR